MAEEIEQTDAEIQAEIQELNILMVDPDTPAHKRRAYMDEAIHLNSKIIVRRQLASQPPVRRIL